MEKKPHPKKFALWAIYSHIFEGEVTLWELYKVAGSDVVLRQISPKVSGISERHIDIADFREHLEKGDMWKIEVIPPKRPM